MSESQRSLCVSSPQQSLWLRFTGYDVPNFEQHNVVIQSRREFSPLVRARAPFQFSSPIDCKLRCDDQSHCFVLYALQTRSLSLKNGSSAAFRFCIDAPSVLRQLKQASEQRVALHIRSADGMKLAYEASLQAPLYSCTEEASVLSSVEDDVVSVSSSCDSRVGVPPLDLSFSSVSEEADSGDDSPLLAGDSFLSKRSKRGAKVRFCDTLQLIPSTEQLKKQADMAATERAQLSRCVGDLASQLAQLQAQLRQLKQGAAHDSRAELLQSGTASAKRRRVVIDGDSVARAYGKGKFKAQGISVALQYYGSRGFHAVAVVSKRMTECGKSSRERSRDDVLTQLIDDGLVEVSCSEGKRQEFIVRYALDHNALVVCNARLRAAAGTGTRCSKRELRRIQAFVDSHRVAFMFVANEFVPTATSLRPSQSSECLRSDGL